MIASTTAKVCIAMLLAFSCLGRAREAHASSTFPPVLRDALAAQFGKSFCIPQCTACHLTTQGGPRMLNQFGQNLEDFGGLMGGGNEGLVTAAVPKYFAMTPPPTALQTADHQFDSDGDGVSDRDELIDGDSPSVASPLGQGQFCADIKYGCAGGRIAAASPPADRSGLLAVAVALAGFGIMRRRDRYTSRERRLKDR